MATKKELDRIRLTDRRATAWQKRVAAFESARDSDSLSDAELAKLATRLERQRDELLQQLEAQRPLREELAQPRERPGSDNSRRQLLELRYEIDEDLAAGRMTEAEHSSCRQRIEDSLRHLDEPGRPGETIRVVGIPRKKIDIEKLALVYWLQARRQIREKQGLPPPTDEEVRHEEILWLQTKAAVRADKQQEDAASAKKQEAADRRFRSNKPRQLRQATWDWLLDQGLRDLPADGHLGAPVAQYGIFDAPELLRSTVIQLDDAVDYIIDSQTVRELASSSKTTTLVCLSDRQRRSVAREAIEHAVADGPIFDQLDV